jgi:predicted AAA+ superfamily ATPase
MTASNYLGYAQSAYLILLLYPYSRKIKERHVKPKLYVSDTGIIRLFGSDRGKWLENNVLLDLTRRRETIHYYRSRGADVDFLVTRDNKPVELIQVSCSISEPHTYAREVDSIMDASEKLDCYNLTIVTFNEERVISRGGKVIKVVPAWKWLLR